MPDEVRARLNYKRIKQGPGRRRAPRQWMSDDDKAKRYGSSTRIRPMGESLEDIADAGLKAGRVEATEFVSADQVPVSGSRVRSRVARATDAVRKWLRS